jgi:hypothetical protein
MAKISSKLQPILWSKNVKKLDLEKDKIYIIHQILSYGNLNQIKWLFRVYSKKEIRKIFVTFPKKIYHPAIFYFVKNFVLNLKNEKLDEKKYLKTSLRNIK